MEVKKGRVASLLLLVLVLASQEMLCRGQEMLCGSIKDLFRGDCKKKTCRAFCENDGFSVCHFKWFLLNRKCLCLKFCGPAANEVAHGIPSDYSTNPQTTGLGR